MSISRMHYIKKKILLAGILLILVACSSVQITHETSAPVMPVWINSLPQKTGMLYFVGIASDADSLEQGRDAAMADALAKISNAMVARVELYSEDLLTETEQHIRRQIKTNSGATVRGAYETDSYYEKTVRVEKNIRMEKYDVYVLVGIKLAKLEAEIELQRKDFSHRVKDANELYQQGKMQMQRRSYAEAKQSFERALKLLEDIEGLVIQSGGGKDNRQLALLLKSEIQNASLPLKRISISVNADNSFYAGLAAVMSDKGYSIAQDRPAFAISGNVSLNEGGSGWDRWVCHAEGYVTATRISDGQVVTTINVKGVGIHQNRRQATVDALNDAAEKVGNELAEKLGNSE
jgi:tetratricopeptide (TPR) repeat protein